MMSDEADGPPPTAEPREPVRRIAVRRIGRDGEVVIAKPYRDALEIQPGWQSVQSEVDGVIHIRFVPPTGESDGR